MITVIVGDSPLLQVLKSKVDERRWRPPSGGSEDQQIRFLAANPVPGGNGVVLAGTPADWTPVIRAGWRVYWCEASQAPVGCYEFGNDILTMSVMQLAQRLWGQQVNDTRLVGDIMLGIVRPAATTLFVTGFSGGIGKTVTSRRLCERASQMGIPTLLVDGNMLQSSQRSFFDPKRSLTVRTVSDWTRGAPPQKGANPGKQLFGIGYDLAFAPPVGTTIPWEHYADYIAAASRVWRFIVVDLDRISAADLDDPNTAAGGLMVPAVKGGDLALFIVKAGKQTQADAMTALMRMNQSRMPKELMAIKDTVPAGLTEYTAYDYSPFGSFMGTEQQTEQAGRLIAEGKTGWNDSNLDLVRERILQWALPDQGFDPRRFETNRGRKGRRRK